MEYTIHPYQRIILKKLMYNPKLKFSQLQLEDLTSKHFTYHLNQLKKYELIEKSGNEYILTTTGKKYVEKVDEHNMKIEQQPKVSVVSFPCRKNKAGKLEILLSKRLKHPNYGIVVGIGGKVKFGETFEEAAHRELMEETGLTGDFRLSGIIRKMGYQGQDNNHEVVLDILFVLFKVENVSGNLIEKNEDQLNFWCPLVEVSKRDDISETLLAFLDRGLKEKMDNFEMFSELEGY